MKTLEILFWLAAGMVLYAWLGYGAFITALARLRKRTAVPRAKGVREDSAGGVFEPLVTLVVAYHNERDWIGRKIENTLELDYPEDKLKIVMVEDGSDDGSGEIPARYPRVSLLRQRERRGKAAALNAAMKAVETEITVFSDANAMLNREAIRELVAFFRDPAVGCVCGEKRVRSDSRDEAAGAGEGTYWRYESRIRAAEARLGYCVGAMGELYAIRTALFRDLPEDTIVDDFVVSMRIAFRGYRVLYTPGAYAVEVPSAGLGEEMKRKIRIAAGNLQAFLRMPGLLNPFRNGRIAFLYFSHKFLRSFVIPFLLPALFFLNLLLLRGGEAVYVVLFVLQVFFYSAAGAGYLLRERAVAVPFFFVPFYVTVMNLSALAGIFRYLRGRQSALWERAARQDPPPEREGTGP